MTVRAFSKICVVSRFINQTIGHFQSWNNGNRSLSTSPLTWPDEIIEKDLCIKSWYYITKWSCHEVERSCWQEMKMESSYIAPFYLSRLAKHAVSLLFLEYRPVLFDIPFKLLQATRLQRLCSRHYNRRTMRWLLSNSDTLQNLDRSHAVCNCLDSLPLGPCSEWFCQWRIDILQQWFRIVDRLASGCWV